MITVVELYQLQNVLHFPYHPSKVIFREFLLRLSEPVENDEKVGMLIDSSVSHWLQKIKLLRSKESIKVTASIKK